MLIRSISAFILLFSSCLTYCQQTPPIIKNYTPPAPNAASLGKYADFPVSYHTGIPSINVPIHSIKQGSIQVDLSLSYHASGIKVSELSSWVGLGWTLNAGGCISRSIIGAPDELNHSSFGYGLGPGGYYNNYGLSTLPPLNIDVTSPSYNKYQLYNDVAAGYSDCEPDLFFYNFNGYSGKFVFDENRIPRLLTDDNVKIKPVYTTNEFSSWVITTPDGISYYFGEGNSKEKTRTYSNQSGDANDDVYSSWYLNRIENPNTKDIVYLDYATESYGYFNLPTESILYDPVASPCAFNSTVAIVKTYVQGVRLSQIRTSNQVVSFEANTAREDLAIGSIVGANNNTQAKRLDNIKIATADGEVLKNIALGYSYFVSSTSSGFAQIANVGTSDVKRLKLLSVQESAGTASISPYLFEYDEAFSLPRRLSCDQDHWGYANSSSGGFNQRLTPNVSNCNSGGANRNTNPAFVKSWSLKKVIQPLGGYSEFFFGVHHTDDYFASEANGSVGGLRIERIVSQANSSAPAVVKEYEYSEAVLYSKPNYLISILNEYFLTGAQPTTYTAESFGYTPKLLKQSSSITPMLSVNGSHIGYVSVKEKNSIEGYSIYKYKADNSPIKESRLSCYNYIYSHNLQANGLFNQINPQDLVYATSSYYRYPFAPEQINLNRGTLESVQAFNQNGDLLKSTVYTRQIKEHKDYWVRGFKVYKAPKNTPCNSCDPSTDFNYALCYYKLNTGYSYVSSKVESSRDISGNTTSITTNYTYESDVHILPTKETFVNSKGEATIKKTFYSFDYSDNSTPDGTIAKLKQQNILTPISERVWKNNQLISGVTKRFHDFSSTTTQSILAVSELLSLEAVRPLSASEVGEAIDPALPLSVLYPNSQLFKTKVTFQVDDRGSVKEQQLTGSFKHAYIWNNDLKQPNVQVINAGRNEVLYSSFEQDGIVGWYPALTSLDNSRSFTGKRSGYIENYSTTGKAVHSTTRLNISLSAPKKFHYSGWVYSDGPNAAIYLLMLRAGEEHLYASVHDYVSTTETGKWVYLEKDFEVPQDIVQMYLRLDNNGGGKVWFDDVRLHPSDAQMTTYTYDPLIGMTSQSDANNKPVYYEYDRFNRLRQLRDQDRNVIKVYDYQYQKPASSN